MPDGTAGFRRLPHNLEVERGLIGLAMLHPGVWQKVANVPAEAFGLTAHRAVWRACAKVMAAGAALPDAASLWSELADHPDTLDAGGYQSLLDLLDTPTGPAQARYYAEDLLDLHRRRRLIEIAEAIQQSAYDGADSTELMRELAAATAPAADGSVLGLLSSADFVGSFVQPDYLIEGVIRRGFLYTMTGLTGSGKTAVALHLAACLATGTPFAGREVEQCRVAYLAGENPDDVRARHIAQCEAMQIDPESTDIFFRPEPFNIAAYEADLKAASASRPFGIVIIDTAAAFFSCGGGEEENDNVELGNFARTLRRVICGLPGHPAAIVPAHPTKGAQRGNLYPRGGGAFLNEVDGNLTLWSEERGITELGHNKLRGPAFDPIVFKLEERTSDRLRSSKGRLLPSIIATPMTDAEEIEAKKQVRDDLSAMLDMLINYPRGPFALWLERLNWTNKSRISRALERLRQDNLVTKTELDGWKLTKAGESKARNLTVIG